MSSYKPTVDLGIVHELLQQIYALLPDLASRFHTTPNLRKVRKPSREKSLGQCPRVHGRNLRKYAHRSRNRHRTDRCLK
ncbi:Uncharacterised protein [Vibrio cholerae]|nr:Uncharacterised protein [Vibrio cholerae]